MQHIIAAISTPAGGAIGMIRLSGAGCAALVAQIFQPAGDYPFTQAPNRKLIVGELSIGGRLIDHPAALYLAPPHTYTGEEMVELHCHGSAVILSETLSALLKLGARMAEAGEFTRRAFLNGKLSLHAAEAVNDLISARSREAAENAARQMEGHLSQDFAHLRTDLLGIAAQFLAVVDYPDEDIDDMAQAEFLAIMARVHQRLRNLADSYEQGRMLSEGLACAIIGRPNVGKSTILNALAGFDRAIVSDIAGTTRDTVEHTIRMGALLLRLQDTAGMRQTADPIEQQGVVRAQRAAQVAPLVLAVFDGSQPFSDADAAVLGCIAPDQKAVALVNKADLPQQLDVRILQEKCMHIVPIAAKKGQGLDDLRTLLPEVVGLDGLATDGSVITNARQSAILVRAAAALETAMIALQSGMTPDAVLMDVEQAIHALGELTGANLQEDVVHEIFARFCVGK